MGLDKKKLLCGNCKLWQKEAGEFNGAKMGRCNRTGQPVMSLSPACNFLTESNFADSGYKLEKVAK